MSHQVAILLFSRQAHQEAMHKSFYGKGSINDEIYVAQSLISHVKSTIKNSGIQFFNQLKQKGNSFGERLSHNISEVFQNGYDSVIVIGNDSPELTKENLLQAQSELQKGNIVLGPSKDGGVYLIGLQKKNFDPEKFISDIQWQTDEVQKNLLKYADRISCKVTWLEEHSDIDFTSDFYRFLKNENQKLKSLKNKLTKKLIKAIDLSFIEQQSIYYSPILQSGSSRAPPIFIS